MVLRHCLKLTWFNSCTCNFYQKKKHCTFNSLVRNFCRPPPRKTPLSFKRKYFTCHAGNALRDLSDVEPVSCSGSLFPDGRSVDRTSKHLATLTSNVVSFSLWTLNGEKKVKSAYSFRRLHKTIHGSPASRRFSSEWSGSPVQPCGYLQSIFPNIWLEKDLQCITLITSEINTSVC